MPNEVEISIHVTIINYSQSAKHYIEYIFRTLKYN